LAVVNGAAGAQERPQSPPQAPGVITEGSGDTQIGGLSAARGGDATSDAGTPVVGGSPNVFINGRPAATLGDKTGCGGVTVGGAANVFINGKPAARVGDLTTGCPGNELPGSRRP
jgi:uncharacterized Zn-binding protein involved in type VI secretion